MGCFQPDDASAHTSYLIVLLKSGPGFLPSRPTIIQAGTDRSTGLEAFFRPPRTPWRAKERRIIRTASEPSTVFRGFSAEISRVANFWANLPAPIACRCDTNLTHTWGSFSGIPRGFHLGHTGLAGRRQAAGEAAAEGRPEPLGSGAARDLPAHRHARQERRGSRPGDAEGIRRPARPARRRREGPVRAPRHGSGKIRTAA